MIRKAVVRKFLEQPRKDFRGWKKLSVRELNEKAAELPVTPPIWGTLRKLQKVCFLIGVKTRRFYYLNDTGTGKTVLSIALACYFRKLGLVRTNLVLVPKKVNKEEWVDQINEHSPSTSYCVLTGPSTKKWEQLRATKATLVIETYAGFTRMVCKLVAPKKGKARKKLQPDKKLVRELAELIAGLYLDESTFIKNHRALPYRICRQISKTAEVVFPLTGTPFGRDPIDLWAQMFVVDRGETLGQTLGLFRATFFTEHVDYWGRSTYVFDKKKKPLLNRVLANRSIRYEADEADLPRVVPVIKKVTLPQDIQTYYNQARGAVIAAHGNYQEMKNAFLRMRQLSSGFLGYVDDETGAKAKFEFPTNPKLDMLLGIVEAIPRHQKIIIYIDFIFSGRKIGAELDNLGIEHADLYGVVKNEGEVLRRYKADPKCNTLLLSNSTGGFGLNLQVTKYGIYYESPVSTIVRRQTERRFIRQESPHQTVFRYDLVARGTADEQILLYHKQGGDLFQAIVQGK